MISFITIAGVFYEVQVIDKTQTEAEFTNNRTLSWIFTTLLFLMQVYAKEIFRLFDNVLKLAKKRLPQRNDSFGGDSYYKRIDAIFNLEGSRRGHNAFLQPDKTKGSHAPRG